MVSEEPRHRTVGKGSLRGKQRLFCDLFHNTGIEERWSAYDVVGKSQGLVDEFGRCGGRTHSLHHAAPLAVWREATAVGRRREDDRSGLSLAAYCIPKAQRGGKNGWQAGAKATVGMGIELNLTRWDRRNVV